MRFLSTSFLLEKEKTYTRKENLITSAYYDFLLEKEKTYTRKENFVTCCVVLSFSLGKKKNLHCTFFGMPKKVHKKKESLFICCVLN